MLKALAVAVVTVGAVVFFVKNFRRLLNQVLSGRPEMLWDRVGERVGKIVKYVFLHRKVLEDPAAGIMHLSFFYGFVVLGIGHTEHVVTGLTSFLSTPLTFHVLPSSLFYVFLLSQDVMAGFVLFFGFYALVRRWLHMVPRLEPRSRDAENILWFIVLLYITFFGYNASNVGLAAVPAWAQPLSTPLRGLMAPLGDVNAYFHEFFYWGHLAVFLGFLNYLPFSKHAHLMAAFPNIFLDRFGPRGKPTVIDFETAETYGVSKVTEYSWKDLLDGYACTECGRCNSVCPAHLTMKPLQPKKVIHDVKENLQLNQRALTQGGIGPIPLKDKDGNPVELPHALITKAEVVHDGAGTVKVAQNGGYDTHGELHVDEIWACTTCGACMEICPVLITSVPAELMETRRHLVMTEADFPQEMAPTFKNIEGQANPWGIPQSEREKWAEGLDVPVMRDKQEVDVLFWVGCAGATDDRAKKTQRAFVQLLKAAGVNYGILGTEEKCTGDVARRMGNEYLFQNMCTENQATLGKYKFKEIVSTCPHCINSLGNEYQDYGAPKWKVRHHTELIDELMTSGKLKLKQDGPAEKITFHDPCYLGRYMNVYDAPRNGLRVLNNVELREMERAKQKSFCCGAGGGRIFMEEHIGKRVNVERTEQAIATGADTIAVGCPFCMTMITDGTKAKGVDEKVAVKDVAEIVASRLA